MVGKQAQKTLRSYAKYAVTPLGISLLFFIGNVVLFAVPGAWLIQEYAV